MHDARSCNTLHRKKTMEFQPSSAAVCSYILLTDVRLRVHRLMVAMGQHAPTHDPCDHSNRWPIWPNDPVTMTHWSIAMFCCRYYSTFLIPSINFSLFIIIFCLYLYLFIRLPYFYGEMNSCSINVNRWLTPTNKWELILH